MYIPTTHIFAKTHSAIVTHTCKTEREEWFKKNNWHPIMGLNQPCFTKTPDDDTTTWTSGAWQSECGFTLASHKCTEEEREGQREEIKKNTRTLRPCVCDDIVTMWGIRTPCQIIAEKK